MVWILKPKLLRILIIALYCIIAHSDLCACNPGTLSLNSIRRQNSSQYPEVVEEFKVGIRRKPYTLKNRIKLSKKDRDIIQSLDGKHSLEHYNKDNLKINFPKESSPMPPRKLHYRNRLMMRYSVKNVSQWFYTSSTGDIIRGVVGLILLGSTLYYFKSGQQIMKIISTIGCISILIILCLLKLMA